MMIIIIIKLIVCYSEILEKYIYYFYDEQYVGKNNETNICKKIYEDKSDFVK